ncbi:hypothetical protein NBRC116494_10590 [Aurantivibrio plasticivorans]
MLQSKVKFMLMLIQGLPLLELTRVGVQSLAVEDKAEPTTKNFKQVSKDAPQCFKEVGKKIGGTATEAASSVR